MPLLKTEFLGDQFSASHIVKLAKSGGAMAPLAPLLTTALPRYANAYNYLTPTWGGDEKMELTHSSRGKYVSLNGAPDNVRVV